MKVVFFACLSALNTTCNNIDEFECGNGDCINYTLTCNGKPNCKDKSDEKQSYCGKGNLSLCLNIVSHLFLFTFVTSLFLISYVVLSQPHV